MHAGVALPSRATALPLPVNAVPPDHSIAAQWGMPRPCAVSIADVNHFPTASVCAGVAAWALYCAASSGDSSGGFLTPCIPSVCIAGIFALIVIMCRQHFWIKCRAVIIAGMLLINQFAAVLPVIAGPVQIQYPHTVQTIEVWNWSTGFGHLPIAVQHLQDDVLQLLSLMVHTAEWYSQDQFGGFKGDPEVIADIEQLAALVVETGSCDIDTANVSDCDVWVCARGPFEEPLRPRHLEVRRRGVDSGHRRRTGHVHREMGQAQDHRAENHSVLRQLPSEVVPLQGAPRHVFNSPFVHYLHEVPDAHGRVELPPAALDQHQLHRQPVSQTQVWGGLHAQPSSGQCSVAILPPDIAWAELPDAVCTAFGSDARFLSWATGLLAQPPADLRDSLLQMWASPCHSSESDLAGMWAEFATAVAFAGAMLSDGVPDTLTLHSVLSQDPLYQVLPSLADVSVLALADAIAAAESRYTLHATRARLVSMWGAVRGPADERVMETVFAVSLARQLRDTVARANEPPRLSNVLVPGGVGVASLLSPAAPSRGRRRRIGTSVASRRRRLQHRRRRMRTPIRDICQADVRRLVDLGFGDVNAAEALRANHGDVRMAAKMLFRLEKSRTPPPANERTVPPLAAATPLRDVQGFAGGNAPRRLDTEFDDTGAAPVAGAQGAASSAGWFSAGVSFAAGGRRSGILVPLCLTAAGFSHAAIESEWRMRGRGLAEWISCVHCLQSSAPRTAMELSDALTILIRQATAEGEDVQQMDRIALHKVPWSSRLAPLHFREAVQAIMLEDGCIPPLAQEMLVVMFGGNAVSQVLPVFEAALISALIHKR